MSMPPTGTVTFLFTDIEGSTALWELDRAAMQAALAQHHVLLRTAIESNGGHVFNIVGDAFCAAFATAPAAVTAALSAQRSLRDAEWGETPLRVRMGLHTGSAEAVDHDYRSGPALNRVARVMGLAHGGQILLSQTTADLVRGQGLDVSLRALGLHQLKGLAEPEQILQVVAPGLPSDFPPLASATTIPNNLPMQLSSFVGREHELAETRKLLAGTRLLTLTGSGGAGKTRLTLQVASLMLGSFPDGVWLVELAPVIDPATIPQAVALALRLTEQPNRPTLDSLRDYLRIRRALIILDNCEHVIQATAELADSLLRSCPALSIVATSREALGIAGETAWRVPSLRLPQAGANLSVTELMRYEAVQLFVERARTVEPGFALTEGNRQDIIEICRRLDGMPLALELAAARIAVLSPQQIAQRLADRFRLLTGGSRTSLSRQRTLRATMDWSYSLLVEPERALLRRLSVFVNGWALEAVEAVCSDQLDRAPAIPHDGMTTHDEHEKSTSEGNPAPAHLERTDVLDMLTSLANKSLVVVERRERDSRYSLPETIRQYAQDKLLESDETSSARNAHLVYFVAFAENIEAEFDVLGEIEAANRGEAELHNMRAAFEWAMECRQNALALRLINSAWPIWRFRGAPAEAIAMLQRAQSPSAGIVPPELYARSMASLSRLEMLEGDLVASKVASLEALRIAEQTHDVWARAMALLTHGIVLGISGDRERSRTELEECLRLWRELDVPVRIGNTLTALARLASAEGDLAQAESLTREALAVWEKTGAALSYLAVRRVLGRFVLAGGRDVEAAALMRESLVGLHAHRFRSGVLNAIAGIVELALARDSLESATCLLGAIEGLQSAQLLSLNYIEKPLNEYHIETVKSRLAPEIFERAWAKGLALNYEDAVAYALGVTYER